LGLATQVNTTLHPGSIDDLSELSELMEELEIALWSVFVMVPTGRASKDLMPSADQIEAAFGQLLQISKGAPYAVKTTAGPHYRRLALEEKKVTGTDVVVGARGPQAMWVNEGRGLLFVSHLGEIFPSGFLPVPCGNVRAANPVSVYRNHPTFRLLRDSNALKEKCRACNYRNVCGGARARAFAMTGDLLGADPLCAYVPPNYKGPVDVFQGPPKTACLPVLRS
jgi:radical SAM protein with 4Fe4S-binding SPASM domain